MTKTFIKIGAISYDTTEWESPSDRTFREAWQATAPDVGTIEVDMEKAKEIWRDKIRMARNELFPELDAKFMVALETGADTTQIAAEKQALRDAPADPAIDAATTPEELRAVQPAGLSVDGGISSGGTVV